MPRKTQRKRRKRRKTRRVRGSGAGTSCLNCLNNGARNNASALPLLADNAIQLERATELVKLAIPLDYLNNPKFNFGNSSLLEFLPKLIVSTWNSRTTVYVPYEILIRNASHPACQNLIKESLDTIKDKSNINSDTHYNEPANYQYILNQVDTFGPVNVPNFLPKHNFDRGQSIAIDMMTIYTNLAVILGMGFIWANRDWFTPTDAADLPTGCIPRQRGRFITYCEIEDNDKAIEEAIKYLLGYDDPRVQRMFMQLSRAKNNARNVNQETNKWKSLSVPLL